MDETTSSPTYAAGRRLTGALWDATALVLLIAVFVYLESHDGGFLTTRRQLATVAIICLVAFPAVASVVSRLSIPARIWLFAWGLGLLLSVGFATVRTGFVHPLLVLGIATAVGLSVLRIWKRSWGPRALFAVLSIAFLLYYYHALLAWWGGSWGSGTIFWAPLSWHNQSSILMGGFAIFFFGVALVDRAGIRLASGLFAAWGLAGAWLAGSRGGVLFTGLGLTVTCALSIERIRLLRALGTLVAVLILAIVSIVGMRQLPSNTAGSDPKTLSVTSRKETAEASVTARIYHIEAAIKMFAARPLTGQGLGSYPDIAYEYTRPTAKLTASAHNEYVQLAGEGGIAAAIPLYLISASMILRLVGKFRTYRRLRRESFSNQDLESFNDRPPLTDRHLRAGLALGAGGAVVALGGHAAIDFDWLYAVLAALLAVSAAVTAAEFSAFSEAAGSNSPVDERFPIAARGIRRASVFLTTTSLGTLAAVLALGIAADAAMRMSSSTTARDDPYASTRVVPWDAQAMESKALGLSSEGKYDDAKLVVDRARRWNPGIHDLETTARVVDYRAGKATSADVMATLVQGKSSFQMYNFVAKEFIERRELSAARSVLDGVFGYYAEYPGWFSGPDAVTSWRLLVRLKGLEGGCETALAAAENAYDDRRLDFASTSEIVEPELNEFCGIDPGRARRHLTSHSD